MTFIHLLYLTEPTGSFTIIKCANRTYTEKRVFEEGCDCSLLKLLQQNFINTF